MVYSIVLQCDWLFMAAAITYYLVHYQLVAFRMVHNLVILTYLNR